MVCSFFCIVMGDLTLIKITAMYCIIIFIFSFHTILFPAHELSTTHKLLLREKAGANLYAWDDHDSKTIAALFLVDKDLNQSITIVRDSLIKKFPQFPLAQSAIVCNHFRQWCAFKQNDARDKVDIFFGSQEHAQSYYLYDTKFFESLYIEPVTYDTEGSFCMSLNQDRFNFLLISPEKKRVCHVRDSSEVCIDSFLDSCGITLPFFKRALPYLAGSVFKKVAYDGVGYVTYRSGKRADSIEDVRLVFDSRDFYSKAFFVLSPKLLPLQAKNGECACTPESIDDKCKSRYEALGSVFSQEHLFWINNDSLYDRSHCFSLIGKNPSQTKTFYANPFGQIFITDAVFKFSDNVGTIDILQPANWEMFSLPEKAAFYAKECFIVGDVLCYRGSDTSYLKTLCVRKSNSGFLEATVYKIMLPRDDVTIVDGVERFSACHLLLQAKNRSNEFALISCDIQDCFARDPKIRDFSFNTIEAARDHYYRNRHRSSYPGFFDQQCIRGPKIVLQTLMADIRNNYDGPIKELSKDTVTMLKIPACTPAELDYNGQTFIEFQPKNFIDRVWYALKIKTADLPRDMKREFFYAFGGLGTGLVAGCLLLIDGFHALRVETVPDTVPYNLALLVFSVSAFHHFFKNDEAKSGREFSTRGKMWPYPLLCLVGYTCFNSLKSQLLYAAMPIWFHLYDRIGMFIKPPTVNLPFNTLYNTWPARMRRAVGERLNNSNTFCFDDKISA